MRHLTVRTVLAGLATTLATAVLCLPGSPASAAVPGLDLTFDQLTLTTGSTPVAQEVRLRGDQGASARNVVLTFNTADLDGVATIVPDVVLGGWWGCDDAGTLITCAWTRTGPYSFNGYSDPLFDLIVTPAADAAPGAGGTLAYTVTADGSTAGGTSRISVSEGVDLAIPDTGDVTGTVPRGGTFQAAVGVSNPGTRTVHGTVLVLDLSAGLRLAGNHSNCHVPADDSFPYAYCEFDQDVLPGAVHRTWVPLGVDSSVRAPSTIYSSLNWYTPVDWTVTRSRWGGADATFVPGTGAVLSLAGAPASTVERAQTDTVWADTTHNLVIRVTGSNPVNFAAVGASVPGTIGVPHEIQVGLRNAGSVRYDSADGELGLYADVRFPSGVTVTAADENCEPVAPGEYRCVHPESRFPAGAQQLFGFELVIDVPTTDVPGTVTMLSLKVADGDAADDVAEIRFL
ncbi:MULTISPECIES: hypothetical protein [Catenuloplanes]|uniref:DUF11 domain-containing protein n=1 Tax=Catenuloplanes niger TaxID=587534 RepID=A0AAE4CWD8_9ACTN|nr:hypothetical protein [Catenuloplanes niger]MDR7323699.1 hypothetical protein [Catenuloplanes niger]